MYKLCLLTLLCLSPLHLTPTPTPTLTSPSTPPNHLIILIISISKNRLWRISGISILSMSVGVGDGLIAIAYLYRLCWSQKSLELGHPRLATCSWGFPRGHAWPTHVTRLANWKSPRLLPYLCTLCYGFSTIAVTQRSNSCIEHFCQLLYQVTAVSPPSNSSPCQ